MRVIQALALGVAVALAGSAGAEPVNSRSYYEAGWVSLLDGTQWDLIEYYIQTDKAHYLSGEQVEVLHRVTSMRSEGRVYTWNFSPPDDLYIWHDDELIWSYRAATGGGTFPAPVNKTLLPGESWQWSYTWNLTDLNGDPVQPGEYRVQAQVSGTSTMSIPITVVPEPSILLWGLGPLLLLGRRHR